MSLQRPEPLESTPSVEIRFVLQDPRSLTGGDEREITIKARRGDSILGAALDAGINIEHACGGVCACSTCHVYIQQGEDALCEPEDEELDRVEEAPGLQRNSRLACQCRILKSATIRVEVPAWNRNAVKETPH
jgi:ferredoxin